MTKERGPYPPIILLACIGLQALLHFFWPVTQLIPAPWNLIGVGLIAIGVLIVALPAASFKRADTTILPFQESSSLVTTGIYRVTRNPMYLGMLSVLLGIAVLSGSLSPFLAPALFVPILNRRVIRHEERMLQERFGAEYDAFRQQVRRWL